jgi:hypothetical protein
LLNSLKIKFHYLFKNFIAIKNSNMLKKIQAKRAAVKVKTAPKIEAKAAPKKELKAEALEPCACAPVDTIPFCISISIPPGFDPVPSIGAPTVCVLSQTDLITCQNLKCSSTVPVTFPNPCGGADLTCDGTVELNKLHYGGSLGLLLNLNVRSDNLSDPASCGTQIGRVSRYVTIPIDADICVSCTEFNCENIASKITSVFIDNVSQLLEAQCEIMYQVFGHVVLDASACSQVFGLDGVVVCQDSGSTTGFKVQLLDSSMLAVQEQTLTAGGSFSFNYFEPGNHYIRVLSPLGTIVDTTGPYTSQPSQDIGSVPIDCTIP